MNLLFVCSRNRWRSPTAEAIFKNHDFYHAKSAGVTASARIRLSQKMVLWADLIFVMEHYHKQKVKELFDTSLIKKEIIVLDIEDDYF
jgi:protein-tyrosine phosphatase